MLATVDGCAKADDEPPGAAANTASQAHAVELSLASAQAPHEHAAPGTSMARVGERQRRVSAAGIQCNFAEIYPDGTCVERNSGGRVDASTRRDASEE